MMLYGTVEYRSTNSSPGSLLPEKEPSISVLEEAEWVQGSGRCGKKKITYLVPAGN
jgi:hypothetical protein